MANLNARVPIARVTRNLEARITITGVRTFNFRVWLGLIVLRLGARILPIRTHVEVHHED